MMTNFTSDFQGLNHAFLTTAQVAPYRDAEQQFIQLLAVEDLDRHITSNSAIASDFENALSIALEAAYGASSDAKASEAAHLFLQRILYRINRLKLFWYDDLQDYCNERSVYLQWARNRIESAWQDWELSQLDLEALKQVDVKQALSQRAEADLNPPISEPKRFLREEMSFEGYRCLLAIASLDGLVEASRLSRILGGASNEVQATLTRVFLEEYGSGRLSRKHSTFFAQMMAELDLDTTPEGYFDLAPWEVLATINHNFLLTERKRHFLRYNGGLTYFEIAGPTIYTDYVLAAERLGISETAMGYWRLHIKEDERHGQWMLNEVAFPLVDRYPADAWELVLGYDQEKQMGDRAGRAAIRVIQAVEQHMKG
ncbi:MAG TPA: iron-containing redox enzyme family protein [Leptolyngbyaceae cyanobacterium M33_DOE_097]|nr:iron-containing redox enzyme family protein [Leptolyngbyaceae cyanobacterium M33_DOE_097]